LKSHFLKTPSVFFQLARLEAGYLLRKLQQGEMLGIPHSRPMPSICSRCDELRINDESATWRIVYRLDAGAVVIVEIFSRRKGQPE
jgi:phage-related protein